MTSRSETQRVRFRDRFSTEWRNVDPTIHPVYKVMERMDDVFVLSKPQSIESVRGRVRLFRREWIVVPCGPLATPVPTLDGFVDVVYLLDEQFP